MPILHTTSDYKNNYPESVLARTEGLRAPSHVEIDFAIYGVNLSFPPGLFAGTTAGTKYRFLPRTKFKSVAGNIMTVSRWTACVFVPGDVITVINQADGTAGAAVGTVASVDITDDCNKITFTAAPVAPAIDTVIGVAASRPITAEKQPLGLISPNTIFDLSNQPDSNFGCFLGAVVHRSLIPHIDDELEKLFPQLIFVFP